MQEKTKLTRLLTPNIRKYDPGEPPFGKIILVPPNGLLPMANQSSTIMGMLEMIDSTAKVTKFFPITLNVLENTPPKSNDLGDAAATAMMPLRIVEWARIAHLVCRAYAITTGGKRRARAALDRPETAV
jgi:hypothetical protein